MARQGNRVAVRAIVSQGRLGHRHLPVFRDREHLVDQLRFDGEVIFGKPEVTVMLPNVAVVLEEPGEELGLGAARRKLWSACFSWSTNSSEYTSVMTS